MSTWSVTLREGDRLRVLKNKALTRVFELKRDGVTGRSKKFNNEDLHNL
jgi:hypothetical protein